MGSLCALQLLPHGYLMAAVQPERRHVNVSELFKTSSYLLISNRDQVKRGVSDTHWLVRTCLMSSSKKETQISLLPFVRILRSSAEKRCGSENTLSGLATVVKLAGRFLLGQHELLESKKRL